jgi:hypothetical protein
MLVFSCRSMHKLNMWSFERIHIPGTKKGAFHHPFFLRGQKMACQSMSREVFKTHTISKKGWKMAMAAPNHLDSSTTRERSTSTKKQKTETCDDEKHDEDFLSESEEFLEVAMAVSKSSSSRFGNQPSDDLSTIHYTNPLLATMRPEPIPCEDRPTLMSHSLLKAKIAALRQKVSSESSRAIRFERPCYSNVDVKCNSNLLADFIVNHNKQRLIESKLPLAIEKLSSGVCQSLLQSTLVELRQFPASKPSAIDVFACKNQDCPSDLTKTNARNEDEGLLRQQAALEEGDRVEFEGRPFSFVDIHRRGQSKMPYRFSSEDG